MATDTYLTITAELGWALAVLPGDAVKTFLALAGRSMSDGDLSLTAQELADQCDMTRKQVLYALSILSGAHPKDFPNLPTLVKWGTKAGQVALKVDPAWIGQQRKSLTWADEAVDDRLPKIEAENRRLNVELAKARTGETSDVSRMLKGEERDLAIEVEQIYGRALSTGEGFHLGAMISKWGIDRVRREVRSVRTSRDPIRAAYGRMLGGTAGKGAGIRDGNPGLRAVRLREFG